MDIRHLRYVIAVADEGSFTAAAARCFVAQPSLSQAVRSVERELAVDLFVRAGGTRLTPAGEAFVAAARQALRAVERVTSEVAAVRTLASGHLDLAALPTLALDPVAQIVSAFRSRHPGVTVRLAHPESAAAILHSVRNADAEIAITELPARREREFDVVSLGRQEILAVLPPGPRIAAPLDASALAHFPLITQPVGTSIRALTDRFFERAAQRPTIAVETDQRELIVPLVVGGAGVALLPAAATAQAARLGARVAHLAPRQWRRIAVLHRPGTLTPAGRAFLEVARASGHT